MMVDRLHVFLDALAEHVPATVLSRCAKATKRSNDDVVKTLTSLLVAELRAGTPTELERIGAAVSVVTGLALSDICSPSRKHALHAARRLIIEVARRHQWATTTIGDFVGRDHSSVLHALKTMPADDRFKALVAEVEDLL